MQNAEIGFPSGLFNSAGSEPDLRGWLSNQNEGGRRIPSIGFGNLDFQAPRKPSPPSYQSQNTGSNMTEATKKQLEVLQKMEKDIAEKKSSFVDPEFASGLSSDGSEEDSDIDSAELRYAFSLFSLHSGCRKIASQRKSVASRKRNSSGSSSWVSSKSCTRTCISSISWNTRSSSFSRRRRKTRW